MDNNKFAMASEWMVNGNIIQFVKMRWDVNRFELVGFLFLLLTFTESFDAIIAQGCCTRVDIYAR